MPYEFQHAPPWGRSLREYEDMFRLNDFPNKQNILGCADGPASFNYEATKLGHHVLSLDPIYTLPAQLIKRQVEEAAESIINTVKKNKDDYNWNYIFTDPAHLKACRLRNLSLFLVDYTENHNRYVPGELPALPFGDKEFNLALVSNFLFLYDNYLNFDFHFNSMIELTRVADEVRIFPISSTRGGISEHLPKLTKKLKKLGCDVEILNSHYTFIKRSSQTLLLKRRN